jgi:hypothetical protein
MKKGPPAITREVLCKAKSANRSVFGLYSHFNAAAAIVILNDDAIGSVDQDIVTFCFDDKVIFAGDRSFLGNEQLPPQWKYIILFNNGHYIPPYIVSLGIYSELSRLL